MILVKYAGQTYGIETLADLVGLLERKIAQTENQCKHCLVKSACKIAVPFSNCPNFVDRNTFGYVSLMFNQSKKI